MPIFFRPPAGYLRALQSALTPLAWLLALGFCAWVVAALFWQLAAPASAALVAHHEPDPRKVAARIGLHVGRPAQISSVSPPLTASPPTRYTVTGIATGFGTLPGFVILQTDDGATFSLSPGQALPDGRTLVRLQMESAEFELDGRRSTLALPTGVRSDGLYLRPPTPAANGEPRRDH